jgi:hypothetical protein
VYENVEIQPSAIEGYALVARSTIDRGVVVMGVFQFWGNLIQQGCVIAMTPA